MTPVPLIVWFPAVGVVVLALFRLRMPPLAMLTTPLIVAPLMICSRELTTVVKSRVPLSVTLLRKLALLLTAWNAPVPLVASVPPLRVTPLCNTVLPFCALIRPPALLMLVHSSNVAPLMACSVLLLMNAPPLAGLVILRVPPLTSAEIEPLLVSVLLPPVKGRVTNIVLAAHRDARAQSGGAAPLMLRVAAASFRLMTAVPLRVWLPPVVFVLSRPRMPPLAMLIAPLIVAPLMMRSRELTTVVKSRVPLSVTLLRKLALLLTAWNAPVPLPWPACRH